MSARLASGMLVSGLIRKVAAEGGNGMVLARGDDTAGAVLVLLAMRGQVTGLRERGWRPDGSRAWIPSGPAEAGDPMILSAYIERRRRSDPDLWVVELDGIEEIAVDHLLEGL